MKTTESHPFVNCTPHQITLMRQMGEDIVLEPCGHVVRVTETTKVLGSLNGIDIVLTECGKVDYDNLNEKNGFIYIVSSAALQGIVKERGGIHNFAAPSSFVRQDGKIIGCNSLKVG
jgi:hypothetical protein